MSKPSFAWMNLPWQDCPRPACRNGLMTCAISGPITCATAHSPSPNRMILRWLELGAEEAGKSRIVLNTLAVQQKAQRFYESSGYV